MGRLRPADWLTGACGLGLFLALWAPWYGYSDGTASAWQALALVDLWLALTALLALGVLAANATRDTPAVPVAVNVWAGVGTLISLPLVLWRLVDLPEDAMTGLEWGAFLAAAAALGAFAGAWLAMRDESPRNERPHPEPEVMQAPPAGAGPEPVPQET